MSDKLTCPLCLGTGLVVRVPNTGYIINNTACGSWEVLNCVLCDGHQSVSIELHTAFFLIRPDFGYGYSSSGYTMVVDNEVEAVLQCAKAQERKS